MKRGFTMIELLVVMAVIGLLLSIISPRYMNHLDKAKDAALRQNLVSVRESIDKFFADKGRYPKTLDELVKEHYMRQIPVDPVTDRADTWVLVPATAQNSTSTEGGIFNVRSGAPGTAREGSPYATW
jgi:general secretion pathway protein G